MPKPASSTKTCLRHGVSPHLICAGAAKAIAFYKAAFGAEEVMRITGPEGRLMHACILINGSSIMLFDEMPQMGALGHRGSRMSPRHDPPVRARYGCRDGAGRKGRAPRGDASRRYCLGRSLWRSCRSLRSSLVGGHAQDR